MKKDLSSVLSVLNYNGQISIRRRAFGQTTYIGGGYSSDVSVVQADYRKKQQFDSTYKNFRILGHGDRWTLYYNYIRSCSNLTSLSNPNSKHLPA